MNNSTQLITKGLIHGRLKAGAFPPEDTGAHGTSTLRTAEISADTSVIYAEIWKLPTQDCGGDPVGIYPTHTDRPALLKSLTAPFCNPSPNRF